MNIQRYRQFDFSLGVQDATTWLLKKPNELQRGINLRFTEKVGGFQRRDGFVQAGAQFSTTPRPPQGGHVAKYTTGSVRFVAVNNAANNATIIRTQNSGSGVWSDLAGISYPVDSVIFFLDYLDEVYISGFDPATGDPVTPYNVDKTLNVSATRNLLNAPAAYFFAEYLGLLYAANVKVGADRFPDRVYKSSPPLGFITSIQGAQTDVAAPVDLFDNVPKMTSNTAPAGTAAASSIFSGSFDAFQAFDDVSTVNNKWVAVNGTTTGWVRYDFGSTKTITYYSITGVPSDENLPNRAPKSWTFEGTNDGTFATWVTLDTKSNQPAWVMGEKRIYSFTNTTAYRYYRVNVSANQGDASILAIAELEFMTSLQGTKSNIFKVDSVRYLKAGMDIDVYKAGTETKLYDINILGVDKALNTFTYTPYTDARAPGDFNTGTDVVTIASTTVFPTGTPVKFASSGTLPTPLVADTTYYAIFVSATTIKLATSFNNAQAGAAIDITAQGSGIHYLRLSYTVSDNDEIWLDGRKGKLTNLWNTDYPTPQATGEYLGIKPGTDSSNTVSAIGKSANRLFVWTKNSGTRWDGQNLIVFNNSVGCISQRSVANIDDDWLIWMDQKGNIRARNENSGQQENISRGIRDKYLRVLTQTQMKAVAAGVVDQTYKLYLGTNANGEFIRVAYDFESNVWSPERLAYPALMQETDDFTGVVKPMFFSNNGYLYQDETGNKDDDKNIAFEAGTGRDMMMTEQLKNFYGILLFSNNCSGLKLECAVDGGKMQTMGRIEGNVCWMKFPENGDNILPKGVALDWQIMGSTEGDPEKVEGAVVYYVPEEQVPSERRP